MVFENTMLQKEAKFMSPTPTALEMNYDDDYNVRRRYFALFYIFCRTMRILWRTKNASIFVIVYLATFAIKICLKYNCKSNVASRDGHRPGSYKLESKSIYFLEFKAASFD